MFITHLEPIEIMGKRKAPLPAYWILQIQDFVLQHDSQAQTGACFNTRSAIFE